MTKKFEAHLSAIDKIIDKFDEASGSCAVHESIVDIIECEDKDWLEENYDLRDWRELLSSNARDLGKLLLKLSEDLDKLDEKWYNK